MNIPSPERWRELSPLLDELLDLAAPARQARLDALRATRPGLADEMAALLAHDSQARSGGFLTGAAAAGPGHTDDASLAGQRLGAYVLQTPLGQGGGGSVWRAHREDGRYDGAVAIKLLHLSLMGRAGAERFRREGQILARLMHPHIARLQDAGVTPGGQPYLVIELVDGQRIDLHCDARRLGIEARLALFDDVLAAVAHAHTHGVIHRDLKPGNILVTADGQVKLLDFGIAKLLDDEAGSAESTALTREGGRALTPEYAAPEQLRGEGVTTATDVYALGVLLYQLLCGQHPTALAAGSAADVIRATLETEPLRLSRRVTSTGPEDAQLRASTPERLSRRLSGDLDTVLAHALRKSATERYPTVAAFAEDLRRCRANEPVLARPDSLGYHTRKFVRRHRGAVAAGLLTALALLAATGVTAWQMLEARAQREEARAQAARSAATQDFLTVMVTEIGADGAALTPRQMLDRGLKLLQNSQEVEPRFLIGQYTLLGTLYSSVGQTDQERELLAKAENLARQAGYGEGLARVLCEQIGTELSAGQRDKARARLTEAQGLLSRQNPPLPEREAACLVAAADLAEADNRLPDAVALAEKSLVLLAAHGMDRHALVGSALSRLSKYHDNLGNSRKAGEFGRQAMDALIRRGHGGTLSALVLMSNEAADLQNYGQLKQSLAMADKLSGILTARGTADADRLNFLANHGGILTAFGRYDQALAVLDRAVLASQGGSNLFWRHRAMYFRALTLVRMGRLEPARQALDDVQAAYGADPVSNKAYLVAVALARAEWQGRSGDAAGGLQLVEQQMKDLAAAAGPVSPALRRALPLAAELALALPQPDPVRAAAWADAAVDAAAAATPEPTRSAHVGKALLLLAQAQRGLGRSEQASQTLAGAILALGNGMGDDHETVASARALSSAWQTPSAARR